MPTLCIIAVSALLRFPAAWDAAASARLAARLQAIRQAGDPATPADLAETLPQPPEGRNAAALYNRAFQEIKPLREPLEDLEEQLPIIGTADLPARDAPMDEPMLAAIRQYLARHEAALELLHQAAELEHCAFDLDFEAGFAMEMPHLASLRHAARLLSLQAVERAESGRPAEAAKALRAALRTGHALRHEPILISALVRIACDALAVRHLEWTLARCRFRPRLLPPIEAALREEADPRLIERAMVGERAMGIDAFNKYVLGPRRREVGLLAPGLGHPGLPLMPAPIRKGDMLCYVGAMGRYVELARRPYPRNLVDGAETGDQLARDVPAYFPFTRMLLPALGRVWEVGQEHMARCESARVALAVLRYQARRGHLPQRLDQLTPDSLPDLPLDPYDGRPLRYRKAADGFVVYALGQNATDDGGETQRRPDGADPPDIGFRYRRPRA
ncbi:MAG: hypothetical protein ACLF0G_17990, partial [Candidatus Brocadiia bacterium]